MKISFDLPWEVKKAPKLSPGRAFFLPPYFFNSHSIMKTIMCSFHLYFIGPTSPLHKKYDILNVFICSYG